MSASAPAPVLDVDQPEVLSCLRPAPLDVHRCAAQQQRGRDSHHAHGSASCGHPALCEDTPCRQSLRSGVGTLPGSETVSAVGRNPCRSRSDRVPMEGAGGPMRAVWPTAADQRQTLAHPSAAMAESWRAGHGRQPGITPRSLSPADALWTAHGRPGPRLARTAGYGFGKARAV